MPGLGLPDPLTGPGVTRGQGCHRCEQAWIHVLVMPECMLRSRNIQYKVACGELARIGSCFG